MSSGHRFDYHTPIAETVWAALFIVFRLLIPVDHADASLARCGQSWLRALHWYELMLGLPVPCNAKYVTHS